MNTRITSLALILQGGVVACHPEKESPFSYGGSSGDTGLPFHENQGDLGDTMWCDTLTAVYGTTFYESEADYADWDGTGGTECDCPVELNADYTPDRLQITMRGSALNDAAEPDPSLVAWRTGAVTPWDTTVTHNQTTWGSADEEWYHSYGVDTDGHALERNWNGRVTQLTRAEDADGNPVYANCSDYRDVRMIIAISGQALPTPVFRKSSTAGAESDRDCASGQTTTTRFQLVDFPGFVHPLPLASGGSSHYAGARVQTVTVTDWQNADELHLVHDGTEVVLTPANPSSQLQATDWYLGTNQWWGDRVADDQTYHEPKIELQLECPTTPVGSTQTVDLGYGLSLQQLDQATTTATGGVGLGSLVTEAEDATIPVYAVRVVPIESPASGEPTHTLRLELRGTWAGASLPLTQTGEGTWSLDTDGPTLDLQGTVTRGADTLTLDLTGGTYLTDAGPLTLQPTTLVLDVLGG